MSMMHLQDRDVKLRQAVERWEERGRERGNGEGYIYIYIYKPS